MAKVVLIFINVTILDYYLAKHLSFSFFKKLRKTTSKFAIREMYYFIDGGYVNLSGAFHQGVY